jgi:hypothetical protein
MATSPRLASISRSDLDSVLTAQFALAWAGESGEEPRLGWWRSDLVSEFGGEDLFQRLLPHTWQWAVFQAAREAARRRDAECRAQDHDPDQIVSLFSFGFEIDERLDEGLLDLKRAGKPPLEALPRLNKVVSESWKRERFVDWIRTYGEAIYVTSPIGRRLKGDQPESLTLLVQKLLAALSPLPNEYPLPHYRRGK